MREVAYLAVYSRVLHSALILIEGLEPASEKAVLVGLDELFTLEFVTVEDVLGKGQRTDRKNKKEKANVPRLGNQIRNAAVNEM